MAAVCLLVRGAATCTAGAGRHLCRGVVVAVAALVLATLALMIWKPTWRMLA